MHTQHTEELFFGNQEVKKKIAVLQLGLRVCVRGHTEDTSLVFAAARFYFYSYGRMKIWEDLQCKVAIFPYASFKPSTI